MKSEMADGRCWFLDPKRWAENIFVSNSSNEPLTYERTIPRTVYPAMINLSHKKLDVWKLSVKATADIYAITLLFPKHELYGLTSQLRRASVSIPSNIAEGAARKSAKERRRFYEIARSSLVEIDTQLEIAKKLDYVTDSDLNGVEDELEHIFAMLSNLMKKT